MIDSRSVSVTILGKEYRVGVSDEQEIRYINDAVTLLNEKMQEVKNSSKTVGSERIAVLTALNITYEMMLCKRSKDQYASGVEDVVMRLRNKLDNVLVKSSQ